jgi:1,6-anhydro-N-acetylmuramate kinase
MKTSSDKIFIGTMSGTSHDGIDICALKVNRQISLLKFSSFKYPLRLRQAISKAIQQQELSLNMYLLYSLLLAARICIVIFLAVAMSLGQAHGQAEDCSCWSA